MPDDFTHQESNAILNEAVDLFSFKNKLGDTPLHSASWKGHADIVQMLLDKGKIVIA
jgi:ankyrin repeat protein